MEWKLARALKEDLRGTPAVAPGPSSAPGPPLPQVFQQGGVPLPGPGKFVFSPQARPDLAPENAQPDHARLNTLEQQLHQNAGFQPPAGSYGPTLTQRIGEVAYTPFRKAPPSYMAVTKLSWRQQGFRVYHNTVNTAKRVHNVMGVCVASHVGPRTRALLVVAALVLLVGAAIRDLVSPEAVYHATDFFQQADREKSHHLCPVITYRGYTEQEKVALGKRCPKWKAAPMPIRDYVIAINDPRFHPEAASPADQLTDRLLSDDHTAPPLLHSERIQGIQGALLPLNYTKCAVVGSSWHLLGRGLGRKIDRHDVVFRFNSAPTKGYEADVGRRTSVRIQTGGSCGYAEGAGEGCMMRAGAGQGKGSKKKCYDSMVQRGCTVVHTSKQMHTFASKYWEVISVGMNRRWKGLKKKDMACQHKRSDGVMEYKCNKGMSSGLFGIFLALNLCGSVDVYGFTAEGTRSERVYYKKPGPVKWMTAEAQGKALTDKHWMLEKYILKELKKNEFRGHVHWWF